MAGDSENVQLMRVRPDLRPDAEAFSENSVNRRRMSTGKKAMIGVVAVALATGAIFGSAIKMRRDKRVEDIGAAEGRQEQRLLEEQATARHIQVANKIVLLMPGARIRDNILTANSKYHGIIPDNINHEIEKGRIGVIQLPLQRKEGDTWLEFTAFKSLEDGDYSNESAAGLAKDTLAVNLSELKTQEKAIVCDVAAIPQSLINYATVSPEFSYQGDQGQQVATYLDMSTKEADFMVASNPLITCP